MIISVDKSIDVGVKTEPNPLVKCMRRELEKA
jgi:hypothetical protein